ncbi:MAG: DUF2202 domain-containing protein [Clostridiales bacterium]|jgi:hypothetical protein|nr:DUF2202 domain-containing protein [Clostridiales bacterium]
MKLLKTALSLAMALTLLIPFTALAFEEGYGANGVEESKTYTVGQMLVYALQDEYLARAEYRDIMATFQVNRPFSNIERAENQHIALLMPLFEAYGVTVPEDDAKEHLALPKTLDEIYQLGVQAEENNIAMYNAFLSREDLPEDVQSVFERLLRASQNHLSAFSNQANLGQNGGGRWRK